MVDVRDFRRLLQLFVDLVQQLLLMITGRHEIVFGATLPGLGAEIVLVVT